MLASLPASGQHRDPPPIGGAAASVPPTTHCHCRSTGACDSYHRRDVYLPSCYSVRHRRQCCFPVPMPTACLIRTHSLHRQRGNWRSPFTLASPFASQDSGSAFVRYGIDDDGSPEMPDPEAARRPRRAAFDFARVVVEGTHPPVLTSRVAIGVAVRGEGPGFQHFSPLSFDCGGKGRQRQSYLHDARKSQSRRGSRPPSSSPRMSQCTSWCLFPFSNIDDNRA